MVKVTLNYQGHYGYVEYDEAKQSYTLVLPEAAEAEAKVREYLTTTHKIKSLISGNNYDLTEEEIVPLRSERDLTIALSRLWLATGVLVEWSMPCEG